MDKEAVYAFIAVSVAFVLFVAWLLRKNKQYIAQKLERLRYHAGLVKELEHEMNGPPSSY